MIKRACEIVAGDVICWAGSLAGAEVIDGWNGEGFTVRWTSNIPGSTGEPCEAYLVWPLVAEVRIEATEGTS